MKNLIKSIHILLASSIVLNGCVTTQLHDQTIQESVKSIVYSPQTQKAYAVGTHYDYELDICNGIATVYSETAQRCLNNVQFLQNKENQYLIENIALDNVIYRTNEGTITGNYTMYLPLSKEQYQYLNNQSFNINISSEPDVMAYNKKYHKNYQAGQLYDMPIYFSGKPIALQNKNEILAQGKLKNPLTFDLYQYSLDKHRSAMLIAKGAVGLVLAPVGFVVMMPAMLIIGANQK